MEQKRVDETKGKGDVLIQQGITFSTSYCFRFAI